MLFQKGGFGFGFGVALLLAVFIGGIDLSVAGYRVIDEMEQEVEGSLATVLGRPTWKAGSTIHVYIPNDPRGEGAEQEVRAACEAWEEKLRSETNANLTFVYHVGESVPETDGPPPYVIEVRWSDPGDDDSAEAGNAFPTTDVAPTDTPNEYRRTSEVKRGDVSIHRTRSGGEPYALNAIYNIALHEFGHIWGLDHKTAEQDSAIMADRGIDDPNKKLPVKDDDVRGLQSLYGRSAGSEVPAEGVEERTGDEEPGETVGTECCVFDCGGIISCVMVSCKAECDGYNGVLVPGTCEKTSPEERNQGVYGRCNGGLDGSCQDCRSDLGYSYAVTGPGSAGPGEQVSFGLAVVNGGEMPTRFKVAVEGAPWLTRGTVDLSGDFAPGSDPFDPPAAAVGCIAPGETITVACRASLSEDVPTGEAVTSSIVLEDLLQRETYVFIVVVRTSQRDYTSIVPEDVLSCARMLAWTSGDRHRTHRDERWDVRESAPREMCNVCDAPMCIVCMEYDLDTYTWRPGVSSSERSCLRTVQAYLRTATREETEVLAAAYWTSYWDGRHHRNRP